MTGNVLTLVPDVNLSTGLGTTVGLGVATLTIAPGGLFTTTFCVGGGLELVTVFNEGTAEMVGLGAAFLTAGLRR